MRSRGGWFLLSMCSAICYQAIPMDVQPCPVIVALPLFQDNPKGQGALVSCLIYWSIYRVWPRTSSLATPLLLPLSNGWAGRRSPAFLGGTGLPHPTVLAIF